MAVCSVIFGERPVPIDPKFFEDYPLYRKMKAELPADPRKLDGRGVHPPIVMHCGRCKSRQTFRPRDCYADGFRQTQQFRIATVAAEKAQLDSFMTCSESEAKRRAEAAAEACYTLGGQILPVRYTCAACDDFCYVFVYRVTDDGKSIEKTGQYPPWSIAVPASVEQALGEHAGSFKKGRICESQGYGIAAFAYYRRIVEEVIAGLLDDIEGVIGDTHDRAEYRRALDNVKGSQSAAARIDVVKELLPASLRPNGVNPLGVMYQALSEGLHALPDEDCLDMAALLRESLVYLVDAVSEQRRKATDFARNIGGLLEKVSKHGQKKTDVK